MRIDVNTGLLVGVKQVLSPFFDERPAGVVPDLVVLHGISLPPGEFGGPWIARLFTGNLPADAHEEFHERAGLRVSAHLLIRRDGEIVQFVSLNDRAWHAGKSAWQGREACNDYSIGIECEGTDDVPYEAAQYATLAGAAAEVVRGLSGDHEGPHRRPFRRRAGSQDRSGCVFRLEPGALKPSARRGTSTSRCPPGRSLQLPDQCRASAGSGR